VIRHRKHLIHVTRVKVLSQTNLYLLLEQNKFDLKQSAFRNCRHKNRVQRRIFGLRRAEATAEWRKLHIDEFYDLYSSPNTVRVIKSRRMRWVGQVARMGERRGVYRVLVGKPEGKRPLGRPRRRWEGNIKMDLQEVR